MSKMAIAGLAAALSLTALASQRASAQYCPPQCQHGKDITFTTGVTFGFHCTPKSGHWVPDCPPPCGPYDCAANQFQAPMPAPVAAPKAPAPNAPKGPAAVQSIGYNYPGYDYNAAYNYGYMYGVPPNQAPAYWYGY